VNVFITFFTSGYQVPHQSVQDQTGLAAAHKYQLLHVEESAKQITTSISSDKLIHLHSKKSNDMTDQQPNQPMFTQVHSVSKVTHHCPLSTVHCLQYKKNIRKANLIFKAKGILNTMVLEEKLT
jgi:hypothetical protein